VQIYLYTNALLYAAFSIWCTLAPEKTAINLGFLTRTPGGISEYLSVYGGLQIGLAVMFWLLGRTSDFQRLGILISIGLYGPIVLYRIATVTRHWPVSQTTVATGCLEVALLIWAINLQARHTS
jgi:hypothetical protein